VPGDAPPEARAHALTTLCYLAGQDRDADRALAAGEEAIALAEAIGWRSEVALAKHAMALALIDRGDPDRAERYVADARVVMEETGNDWHLCALELIASSSALRSGDLTSAAEAARRVLQRATRIGYDPFMCWARLQLGTVAQRAGRPSDARSDLEAALELARDLHLPHYASFAQTLLADVAVRAGDSVGARRSYEDALEIAEAADAPWFAALARVGLAAVREADGEIAEADALLADVVEWGDRCGGGPTRESFFITLAGDPYARALIALGARDLGLDAERGKDRLLRGIDEAVREQDHAAIASALERSAAALVGVGGEQAMALAAAATAIRVAGVYPRTPLEERTVDGVLDAARATLSPEALAAADARGGAVGLDDAPAFLRQHLG
jgi:ATP/maltotriose-dependent transcriptional regulator MalT